MELGLLNTVETGAAQADALWLRSGFPESPTAPSDARSLRWRQNFVRAYLERDIPQFGPRIPAQTLRRFWTMLAHRQARLAAFLSKAYANNVEIFSNASTASTHKESRSVISPKASNAAQTTSIKRKVSTLSCCGRKRLHKHPGCL